jgi:hypothetical protein
MRSSSICAALVGVALVLPGCRRTTTSSIAESATPTPLAMPIGAVAPTSADAPAKAPPIALTASDGTGLRLAKLTGRAVVEEPLAFTELRLVFENPLDRVLEGTFRITLPPGASVSRFAMRQGEGWQEGEVVERQRARRAYEDFLHRKQDPALLEQGVGNELTARVFPIPARGSKELIVSYAQVLDAPYAMALAGLPQVGSIDVAILRPGEAAPVQQLKGEALTPTADFTLDAKGAPPAAALRSGELVLARVRPVAELRPDPVASAIVLFDTSASRALGLDAQIRALAALVAQIAVASGPKAPVTVACFDQGVDLVFDGEAGAFGDAEIARIRERGALGASDLEKALRWARERAQGRGIARVVAMTDGVATAGANEPDALAAAAASLRTAGIERLDVVAVGGIREDALLARVVTAGLARDGVVVDGASPSIEIVRRLTQATRSAIAVSVEDATWSWPTRLDGVQSGDERIVYAIVPEGKPVRVRVGDRPAIAPDPKTVDRPLLERAHAQAKIASLVERQGREGVNADTTAQIVKLSVAHRVLSPYTALLVLETESDYARFGIDRRALGEVLAIDRGRVARMHRAEPVVLAPSPKAANADEKERSPLRPPAHAWGSDVSDAPSREGGTGTRARGEEGSMGDAFGAGGLGLSGIGEGGGGRGEGRAAPAPAGVAGDGIGSANLGATTGSAFGAGAANLVRGPSATIRQGATQVSGRLPPEVIQRIVRQNFGRFRACYERGLQTNPALAGRVTVRFEIGADGSVTQASDGGSDLRDPGVVTCVARSFKALSFPQPEAGTVTVVYPIVFAPGEATTATAASPNAPADEGEKPAHAEPYTGAFKTVMDTLARGDAKGATRAARAWHDGDPGDVMALVALGEAFEASGEPATAARAYGSIVDLFPSRADLRRYAGSRLERIRGGAGLDLALDSFAKAKAQRPDHPSSHRLLAFAWLKKGDPAKAFDAAAAGVSQAYPSGRFAGVERILREDLGLIAAAWIRAEPARRTEILERLRAAGGTVEDAPSLRFVLTWETDANDVDFHIYDDRGGHAFYSHRELPSGGELYADVTTGYGPECFTIRGPRETRASLYTLQAHYYARGPMGYGMGKVEILDHDGKGGISFEERPFVAMVDHAFVDLGVKGPGRGSGVKAPGAKGEPARAMR